MVSGIIVLAVASVLGYHIAYVRPGDAFAKVQQHVREAQQEQETRAQVALSLEALERERQRFAPRPDSDWLLQEVGKLASEAGLEVASLTPRPPQTWGAFTSLAVSLQFHATYHELGRFLNGVERSPYSIRVEELTMSPPRALGGGNPGPTQIQLSVSTLYVPPIMEPTPTTTSL